MSLNCSYKDITWSEYCCNKTENALCEADMIVPDAKSDIAKIISAKASACVLSADCANGRVSVSGEVKFNVLYIGDEESGKINVITKSAPFTLVTSCSDASEHITAIAEATAASCAYTMANSRRIRVSSNVLVSILCCKTTRKSALVKAEGAESVSREVNLSALHVMTKKELSLTDSLDLPSGKSPITEILRQSASVSSHETKILNNKLIVKGNLLISLLYLSDASVCETAIEMPFTEVVEAEGLSPLFKTNVKVAVADCAVTPDTDLSGEYKMINISALLNVTILSSKEESVNIITDAYLPRGSVKSESGTIVLNALSDEVCEEEFIKETLSLTKGHPPILRIFDSSCILSEISFDPDSSVASGMAEVSILYISSDPSNPIASFTSRVPFSRTVSTPGVSNVKAEISNLSYAVSSAENVEIRLNMRFLFTPSQKESVTFFLSLEEEKYTPEPRASIIISIVGDNESVWKIAKRHNIPVADLMAANALTDDTALRKGEKLLIPR